MIKNFFKNFILFTFSTLLILILIELGLRLAGEKPRYMYDITKNEVVTNEEDLKLGWIPKIGTHKFGPWAKEGKNTILTINKDRSRYTGLKSENLDKIVFIGGSLTQGWAISDKETFAFLLQEKFLNHKVFNYAVGGYGGYQSLLTLEKILKEKKKVKNVVYGFIPHHEVRNVAAGSWQFLLNTMSNRGVVRLPYTSLDKKNKLTHYNNSIYFKFPFGEFSSLLTKIEKRIMKIKSSKREKIQTKISLEIIKKMNDITFDNGGKFTLLILKDFYDDRSERYESFLESNKISSIKCVMPTGLKFQVPGEGHPNEISNYQTYECIKKKLKIR
jgi:hypothetical protein